MQLLFFVVPLVAEFSLALQAHMTWSVHTLQKVYKLGVFTTTPQLQSLRCSSVYICFTVLLLLFFSSSYFFSACCGSFVPVQSGPDTTFHQEMRLSGNCLRCLQHFQHHWPLIACLKQFYSLLHSSALAICKQTCYQFHPCSRYSSNLCPPD